MLPRQTTGALVRPTANGWRLEIPGGDDPTYRLAQIDDYALLPRTRLPWQKPSTLKLRCRVSQPNLPGTWGFGLWNDPFAVSFGLQGMARRLPALPNCLWFFHASDENHLSFTQGKPANGWIAQVFSAPRIPSLLMAAALPALPGLFWPPASRALRRLASAFIREDSISLQNSDPTAWHTYQIEWGLSLATFRIDDEIIFQTSLLPRGPLGLVIWIDNQFAAWRPDGSLGMGSLPNPPAWLDVEMG